MLNQQIKEIEQIENNFEKISIKIETNSRGYNTTVHVYQGAKLEEIDDTIKKTIYAHNSLQRALIVKEIAV